MALAKPLIYLRIPNEEDLVGGDAEVVHDHFHYLRMRFGKGYIGGRNHEIEVLFDLEMGQNLAGGDRPIGGERGMVTGLGCYQEVHYAGFGAQAGVEFFEIDALRISPCGKKSGTVTHQEAQGFPYGVHMDEFLLLGPHRSLPDVLHDMAVEAHVGFFGIKQHAVTIEGDDFKGSETIARLSGMLHGLPNSLSIFPSCEESHGWTPMGEDG